MDYELGRHGRWGVFIKGVAPGAQMRQVQQALVSTGGYSEAEARSLLMSKDQMIRTNLSVRLAQRLAGRLNACGMDAEARPMRRPTLAVLVVLLLLVGAVTALQIKRPDLLNAGARQLEQLAERWLPHEPAPPPPLPVQTRQPTAAPEQTPDVVTGDGWRYFAPGGNERADRQIRLLRAHFSPWSEEMQETAAVVADLRAQRYQALDARITQWEARVRQDVMLESEYQELMYAFDADHGVSLTDVQRWVEQDGSYQAYVMRATYYLNAAWKFRGSDYARNTGEDRLAAFHRLAVLSRDDARAALGLKDDALAPYMVMFRLINTGVLPFDPAGLADEADKLFPWSYALRQSYMYSLFPNWGGSYTAMDTYAMRMQKYIDLNPRLTLLRGMADARRGEKAHNAGEYADCINYTGQALKFGIHTSWLRQRADCLQHVGEYDLGLKDINLALELWDSPQSHHVKDIILGKMK